MKAMTQDRYGSADVLELEDVDPPIAGDHDVLIQVQAAGLARAVLHLMTGEPYVMRLMGFGMLRPKNPILGVDVAGTVTAIGAGVTRFKVGDEVFGIARGSYAEYAAAHENKLALKPRTLTFVQAAAMGVSGLTALHALDVARVAAGSSVLIVGASGGVGTYAVQIAVAMGATVTGVASGRKADLVSALGAEHVIDYSKTNFADGERRYDAVLDLGGMTSVSRLRRALTPKGTLVIVGGEGGSTWSPGMGRQLHAAALSPFVSQRLVSVLNKEHYSGLERLSALVAAGQLTPCIERSYPLAQVPDAIRRLDAGDIHGQVVFTLN